MGDNHQWYFNLDSQAIMIIKTNIVKKGGDNYDKGSTGTPCKKEEFC